MRKQKPQANARTRDRNNAATDHFASVVDDMRHRIATQSLLPGSHISELELVSHYAIPRVKAREVLAVLADRSLVRRIPNKGAVVAHVNQDTTYLLYQAREAFDSVVVRLAMQNATSQDWNDFEEMLGPEFEASLKRGDIAQHVERIMAFRDRIKELAQNPILADLMERVYDRMRVTMRLVALLPGRAEMGVIQYRKLLAAMRSGNAADADQCVHELNESAREYISRYQNYVSGVISQ